MYPIRKKLKLATLKANKDHRIYGFFGVVGLLVLFSLLILGIQPKPVVWIKPSHVEEPASWGKVVAERLREQLHRTPKIILAVPTDHWQRDREFYNAQLLGFSEQLVGDSQLVVNEPMEALDKSADSIQYFIDAKSERFMVLSETSAWEARPFLRQAQFKNSFLVIYLSEFFPDWQKQPDCANPKSIQWECQLTSTWEVYRRKFISSKQYFGVLLQHSQYEFTAYLQSSKDLIEHLQ